MEKCLKHHPFFDFTLQNHKLELHVATAVSGDDFLTFEEGRSNFYSLAVLEQGEINLRLNLKTQHLAKNSLILLAPDRIRKLEKVSRNANLHTVIFTNKFLNQIGVNDSDMRLSINTLESLNSLLLTDKEMGLLIKTIEDLKEKSETIHENRLGEQLVTYTFKVLLSELAGIALDHNVQAHLAPLSRKNEIVQHFHYLVSMHFKESRTLKFYADKLSITPKYLAEVVLDATGCSATSLIDEKVMCEAKHLLNDPRLTISQVADRLNFSDQSFLGKYFKRHKGISPSKYRLDIKRQ